MTQFTWQTGAAQTITSRGTFTVNPNCTISLKFTPNSTTGSGSTGSTSKLNLPTAFTGLLTSTNTTTNGVNGVGTIGLLAVTPSSGDSLTGLVIPQ
ncbi:MAG TPA: hypothetical protein VN736_16525 [Candidatus Limnocylindrales bacterium]|nr:hypothetical protein [Candidatus Limnocylindrales bacterium]